MEENKSNSVIFIVVGIFALALCVLVASLGMIGYGVYRSEQSISTGENSYSQSEDESSSGLFRPPTSLISTETVETLSLANIPESDAYQLACRLQGICNVATTLPAPEPPLQVGDKEMFWILNADTNTHAHVEMTLLNITPLTYFWAENPSRVNQTAMKALMEKFDRDIIPTNREFFGSEWTPGVDSDPHIYVLYAGNLGSNIGGYFPTFDEYNPIVRQYSNGHEAYIMTDSLPLDADYAYSTLAHEFVHMIQFPNDKNDATWMTEGSAELGAFLNGYDVGGADSIYVQEPDLQLNDWASNDSPDFGPHYGQSFLYLAYFLDRFGEDATKELVANKLNDLNSIDDTLKTLDEADPQTGNVITADDVFMDWAAAMYLLDSSIGDGRYTYNSYPTAPQTTDTEAISACPQTPMKRDVHQYGIDYINISCSGEHTLLFTGATAVQMLPVNPHSGAYVFATNLGNESDMTLTREFDFTNISGNITFSFYTWYDIEEDYDYLFVEASEDGEYWDILTTPSGTDENPTGNSYGWGYTGKTKGWIKEEVDLSKYAGKKAQIRFEYVTDAAVTGEGFLLDDVSIEAINYNADFESGGDNWAAEGFSRVQNVIPQTFRLALIIKGEETSVQMIQVNDDQTAEIPLALKDGEEAILIISGMTRYTRNSAFYQIEIK